MDLLDSPGLVPDSSTQLALVLQFTVCMYTTRQHLTSVMYQALPPTFLSVAGGAWEQAQDQGQA